MKAVAFTHSKPITDPDSLIDIEVAVPVPRHHDLLVEVKAVSVNPVDTKIRVGGEPLGEPRVLGFDAAGIVRAIGPEVQNFAVGDEVFYAGVPNRPGTNAEFHLVDHRIVGHKPKTLSFAEAAALPLTSLTAWEMLFDRFRIPRSPGLSRHAADRRRRRRCRLDRHPAGRETHRPRHHRHRLTAGNGAMVPRAGRPSCHQPS